MKCEAKKIWTICLRFILLILSLSNSSLYSQHIYINEVLASNANGIVDSDNDSSDWIELFNASELSLNLSGYYLSDDPDNLTKWVFPNVDIKAGGYLLIWASGKDTKTQSELHTNFKLSSSGEFIGLYKPDKVLVDSIYFGPQLTDISFQRFPDGIDFWVNTSVTTPLAKNELPMNRTDVLTASHDNGVYDSPITFKLSKLKPGGTIHYQLFGWPAKPFSSVYQDSIVITNNSVIRAAVYRDGQLSGPEIVRTFIFSEKPKLPILSIVMQPAHLWDKDVGIYVNFLEHGQQWERPVYVTLYEDEETKFSLPAGIRIHGGESRKLSKKGFRLYFRKKYGAAKLNYNLFPDSGIDSFDRLVIYAPAHDQFTGNINPTLFADVLLQSLWKEEGGNISAYKPVVLYLNGSYRGIYWIREYINDDYVESHFGITDCDMNRTSNSKWADIREGNMTYWLETESYFNTHSFGDDGVVNVVATQYINIPNMTDYFIMGVFAATRDWPENNMDRFRDRGGDPRWNFIMWDMNEAWHSNSAMHPTLEWVIRAAPRIDIYPRDNEGEVYSTLVLRKLLENQNFKYYFLNRFADLMNTTLSKEHITKKMNEFISVLQPEMESKINASNYPKWIQGINCVKTFIEQRSEIQWDQLIKVFGLSKNITITVDDLSGVESIGINSLTISKSGWEGTYFAGVPIEISLTPDPDYSFCGWSDSILKQQPNITIISDENITISPIMKLDSSCYGIVINEINYKSSEFFKPGDWIELYNTSEDTIDVGGLCFKDDKDNHEYILPDSILLGPGQFLVLCNDSLKFRLSFPEIFNCIGNFDFGLNREGDHLRLYSRGSILLDEVSYKNVSPWPSEPDGTGSTLMLIDPDTDNSLPVNWAASIGNGTPGRVNGDYIDDTSIDSCEDLPKQFQIYQNYPNPFNSNTTFKLSLAKTDDVDICIYNTKGQKVFHQKQKNMAAGTNYFNWNGCTGSNKEVVSGVYFIRFIVGTQTEVIKTLLIR